MLAEINLFVCTMMDYMDKIWVKPDRIWIKTAKNGVESELQVESTVISRITTWMISCSSTVSEPCRPMNHFAVLIHKPSDLSLTHKVPKKDKPIGKPHKNIMRTIKCTPRLHRMLWCGHRLVQHDIEKGRKSYDRTRNSLSFALGHDFGSRPNSTSVIRPSSHFPNDDFRQRGVTHVRRTYCLSIHDLVALAGAVLLCV